MIKKKMEPWTRAGMGLTNQPMVDGLQISGDCKAALVAHGDSYYTK